MVLGDFPFGLKHKGYNNNISSLGNSTAQKFGYNGKELEESLGLNWLEYGARNYNASLGRFFNIDRYSESFMPISTYQYGANNPVLYMDYNGDYITIDVAGVDVIYENGKTYWVEKDKNGNIKKGDEFDGKGTAFYRQAVKDLNKVGSTKQGGRIIGKLQESSDAYNISSSGFANINTTDPISGNIKYSQKGGVSADGVNFNKSYITLGHELAHAYDVDRGFDTFSESSGVKDTEVNAVSFENYLRALDGETTMRLYYDRYIGDKLGGKTADFFKNYKAPIGRNEVYRLTNVISPTSREGNLIKKDNIRVSTRAIGITKIYDTKKKVFISN
ncbi:protein of unknown function [Tenacibaculum sp. 190524A02b]|uniref:RHS repeat-associated core domain-containing protein n=1 Tax=Tenacibaculum vairaonense TaxID=3137860 RepID=UPI0032B1440D